MYRYETHLHTSPVSKCAVSTVRECLEFYKKLDYDGVFITNHFLKGNINIDPSLPYEEKIDFYFSDYEEGLRIGKEIGIKVFCGIEISFCGTDFLVYGLDKQWYLDHPQIMDMTARETMEYLMSCGAFVVQAHPYREASYIDHIRLFPRSVHGVEIINASRTKEENDLAKIYADFYGHFHLAGSDNHKCEEGRALAGVESEDAINCAEEFIQAVKNGKMSVFTI